MSITLYVCVCGKSAGFIKNLDPKNRETIIQTRLHPSAVRQTDVKTHCEGDSTAKTRPRQRQRPVVNTQPRIWRASALLQ